MQSSQDERPTASARWVRTVDVQLRAEGKCAVSSPASLAEGEGKWAQSPGKGFTVIVRGRTLCSYAPSGFPGLMFVV